MYRQGAGVAAGLILIIFLLYNTSLRAAADDLAIPLASGQEIEIQRFPGSGKTLLLWLPWEHGFGRSLAAHARGLAQMGHEVWLADLHEAYFVEPGRRSIANFPIDDIVGIIEAAVASAEDGVVLLSASRGAQLGLIAAREWQLRNPGRTDIKGVFLAHAYLYQARPDAGESAVYLPIVAATNLPVFLLDAQYSTRSARLGDLAKALGDSGSRVYTRIIPGVQGGFFARDESDLSELDLAAKRDFPRIVKTGVAALLTAPTPDMAVTTSTDTRRISRSSRFASALQPMAEPRPAPELVLDDFHGGRYRLGEESGRVVLVNFWASWCKPCVTEIPSLHRLDEAINDPAFDVVTVNVGEGRDRIDKFLARVPLDLPLLLDEDSRAAKAWKIYVYPSSYLVDHRGHIRYAYLGALEWDSPENIAIIQKLLNRR